MLPAAARLTSSQEFGTVVRRGRRAGRPRLVVHVLTAPQPVTSTPSPVESVLASSQPTTVGQSQPPTRSESSTRVGFVVSKAVGNSVVRHRVARRLRHLMRDRLGTLPPGCSLVVRALPAAAAASSAELGTDLDDALRRVGRVSSGDGARRGGGERGRGDQRGDDERGRSSRGQQAHEVRKDAMM